MTKLLATLELTLTHETISKLKEVSEKTDTPISSLIEESLLNIIEDTERDNID